MITPESISCPRKDCFAASEYTPGTCSVLIEVLEKPGKPCPFYKTREQLAEIQRTCYDRLVNEVGYAGKFGEYLRGGARRIV